MSSSGSANPTNSAPARISCLGARSGRDPGVTSGHCSVFLSRRLNRSVVFRPPCIETARRRCSGTGRQQGKGTGAPTIISSASARLGDTKAFGLLARHWNSRLVAPMPGGFSAIRMMPGKPCRRPGPRSCVGLSGLHGRAGLSGMGLPHRLASLCQADRPGAGQATPDRDDRGPARSAGAGA